MTEYEKYEIWKDKYMRRIQEDGHTIKEFNYMLPLRNMLRQEMISVTSSLNNDLKGIDISKKNTEYENQFWDDFHDNKL